ncbi:hypothetical protein A6X20_30315 [Bradyrhizobium elkanii]|nr:hypothetical protein A6452_09385 [Bradyrhizobium elkanii]ODM76111.1 hypothetical protein A6X20_30315 [Bradyrhizobium elkanii]
MGWPIDGGDFEELTFEYTPDELGIDAKNAAKIQEIKRLRPLSANQPWGIFFVKFEPKSLPVVALRRILSSVALKKRASANAAERAAWAADDLLFISNYGGGEERQISFAHFSRAEDGRDLPTLKVLGWDNLDTALHLDAVAKELTKHLAWPKDDADVEAWRETWRAAFNLRHREVVTTSKELSIRLAELARAIRDRIATALAIETDKGPLTKLMKAFQEALVHDLDSKGFADMYAQTIAYGLLSARIADPHKKTADDFAAHMRTNPFLRELMETFLKVGGRRGKAGGPGIDFDELGVSEVVELLDDANMEAVIRDFGDRNRAEDPVMHFYELFLHEYNRKLKVQRGVFYTPQPIVSYIVRSVHELLQTEFDLPDGLADIATWGEMLKKHPDLKLPFISDEPGETRTISPEEPFVQILDPATGTATFLVEVIDVIYRTLSQKWRQQRLSDDQQRAAWNEYVPRHLLPRLHAYELMMAPYAIAHMKIGLKLAETGYLFETEQRAQIYLTNALEPWLKQLPLIGLDALAHEAAAVNEVKRQKRFTVVIGNPPYSNFGQLNRNPFIRGLLEDYKSGLGEKKINLDDDFIKFVRFSQHVLDVTSAGVFGMITNNVFLDGLTHRQMRAELVRSFGRLWFLNLHGSTKRLEASPDGSTDENVFDILIGVGISLLVQRPNDGQKRVFYADIWGSRKDKYSSLGAESVTQTVWAELQPGQPNSFFVPGSTVGAAEYERYENLKEVFDVFGNGIGTDRDDLFYGFDRKEVVSKIGTFYSNDGVEEPFASEYRVQDSSSYPLLGRRAATRFDDSKVRRCLYRPFDYRWLYYDPKLTSRPAAEIMRHLSDNLALLVTRQISTSEFRHVFIADTIVDRDPLSVVTRERSQVFPLYLKNEQGAFDWEGRRRLNLKEAFIRKLGSVLSLPHSGLYGLPEGLTPESILHYAYAVFHSPTYRARYGEFLRTDFARLPLTANIDLFKALAGLGGELAALHLLQSSKLHRSIAEFVGARSIELEKISWSENTVWVDKAETTGFQGVPRAVWDFHVGGYRICEKWLKDRKGRTLSKADVDQYQKIIMALAETIRSMEKIDEIVDAFGGWPGAFAQPEGGRIIEENTANVMSLQRPLSADAMYQKSSLRLMKVAESDAPSYEPPVSVVPDTARPERGEFDREDLICRIRHLFGDGQQREREAAIDALARELGYQRTGVRIYDELDGAMRAAVRRGITASDRGIVRLFARAIEEYDRDFLKEQFLASLQGRQWTVREEAVRTFARWMGFRRTGPAIEDAARSLINGLLREGRLESAGSEIRRSD